VTEIAVLELMEVMPVKVSLERSARIRAARVIMPALKEIFHPLSTVAKVTSPVTRLDSKGTRDPSRMRAMAFHPVFVLEVILVVGLGQSRIHALEV